MSRGPYGVTGADLGALALERTVKTGVRRGARVRHRRAGWTGTVTFSGVHYAHTTTGDKPRVTRDDERSGNYSPDRLEIIGWVMLEEPQS
jgi:hypothetical protein